MAKKTPKKKPKPEDIETVPDAWERFEKTIGKIVPPKPHKTPKDNGVKKRNSKEEKDE